MSSIDTHLIRLSDSLDDYATRHKLLPFQKWLDLTHQDMFIHGPFDFASVNGHKTWDRISQSDWDKHVPQFSSMLWCSLMFYSRWSQSARIISWCCNCQPMTYFGNFWCWHTRSASLVLTKGHYLMSRPTHFFHQIQMCLLEVWHAEVGTVFAYFA